MKNFMKVLITLVVFSAALFAGEKNPLFTHITSDSVHKSTMALQFSNKMQKKGHHVTIYLTDTGVRVASKNLGQFKKAQMIIADLVKNGANIYICPMCMKEYGVEGEDLVKGLKVGNADLLEKALFAPNVSTINW